VADDGSLLLLLLLQQHIIYDKVTNRIRDVEKRQRIEETQTMLG